MIRPYALHRHFAKVRQETPFIVLMIVVAGSAFALTSNHIWPLIWAAGFVALFTVDIWFAGWLLRSGRDHLRTKTAAIQLGAMCGLTVCGFMIAPIAMISTNDLALAIAATAMLAASATRATGILSISRLSGSITLAPFVVVPVLSLLYPLIDHKSPSEFSHYVACLA
ncbi:MAG: hypothetical protein ACK5ZD_17040, partial [Hyphomonadaceae bacterium]